jgi:hypothetical protein
MKKGDQLVFDYEKCTDVDNCLKETIIRLFVEFGITYKVFTERHRQYMLERGEDISKIPSDRNNLIRAILKDKISYALYERIIKQILRLNLTNMTTTYKDENGKEFVVFVDRVTF